MFGSEDSSLKMFSSEDGFRTGFELAEASEADFKSNPQFSLSNTSLIIE